MNEKKKHFDQAKRDPKAKIEHSKLKWTPKISPTGGKASKAREVPSASGDNGLYLSMTQGNDLD